MKERKKNPPKNIYRKKKINNIPHESSATLSKVLGVFS
jgi:hypothetical protein